jgi:hypothetical protein
VLSSVDKKKRRRNNTRLQIIVGRAMIETASLITIEYTDMKIITFPPTAMAVAR